MSTAFFPPETSRAFARLSDIDADDGDVADASADAIDQFDALDEYDDDGEFDRAAYELDHDVDGATVLDESALEWRERLRRVARRALAALRRVPFVVDARRTLRRQWAQMAFAVAWLLVGLLAMDVATLGAARLARASNATAASSSCNTTHGLISDAGFAFFRAVWPNAAWPKPPGAWTIAPSVAIAAWLGVLVLRIGAHPRGLTVLRRVLFLYGLLVLGRAATLDWTIYPDPSYECTRRALANATVPPPSFLSELVRQSPLWTCGDMMYSGHTVLYCVGWLTSLFYATHAVERVVVSVLLVASAATLVLARVHYTADVVVAILICTPTYALYHTIATTSVLCMQSRFVRWFEAASWSSASSSSSALSRAIVVTAR